MLLGLKYSDHLKEDAWRGSVGDSRTVTPSDMEATLSTLISGRAWAAHHATRVGSKIVWAREAIAEFDI